MKRWLALGFAAALAAWELPSQAQLPSQAEQRVFSQPELEALLAPVALYPDPVLSSILEAATYPEDLREAAAWSRANPQLSGEDAVRAADPNPWHPSVKALLAFPELLVRMDESPQWAADVGAAFRDQEPYVMDAVQNLRRRAQASGSLQSNDQYSVQQEGSSIAVYPAQPQVVYVPYYDPNVVYGTWFWPAYRPVFWQPWFAHPTVFVSSTTFFVRSVDWQRRHVVRHHQAAHHRAPVQGPHGWQWSRQHRDDFRRDGGVVGAGQRAAQRAVQAGQAPVQPLAQNPVQPLARNPVQPLAQNPVQPLAQNPVQPQQNWREQQQQRWNRQEQQSRRGEERTEVRTPRMNPPTPPVPSTNQPRAAHPFIESVRPVVGESRTQPQQRQSRPAVETRTPPQPAAQQRPFSSHSAPGAQVRQAVVDAMRNHPQFQHRGEHRQQSRQANPQQQRRQAGQNQGRRG